MVKYTGKVELGVESMLTELSANVWVSSEKIWKSCRVCMRVCVTWIVLSEIKFVKQRPYVSVLYLFQIASIIEWSPRDLLQLILGVPSVFLHGLSANALWAVSSLAPTGALSCFVCSDWTSSTPSSWLQYRNIRGRLVFVTLQAYFFCKLLMRA